MLIDNVTITIKAGDGGNGAATFRRNAQTPRGGPDGGNGGNGGDVYFVGVNDITALQQFQYKKAIKADDGVAGRKQNMYGKNAEALYVQVPLGTVITDLETKAQWEILDTTQKVLLAKGGRGGRGNNEFKSATNQAPQYAEKGERGETKQLRLELKLIADIGLVGLPNAGKSSLLGALTNATPKIGNYAFTTLEPNLGSMPARSASQIDASDSHSVAGGDGIILADIPGLIEGASTGKGLGTQFLKHIEKTMLLVHCIDSTAEDLLQAYTTVHKEFEKHNPSLLTKLEIIVLTKCDLINDLTKQQHIQTLEKALQKEILAVSVEDPTSLDILRAFLVSVYTKHKAPTLS